MALAEQSITVFRQAERGQIEWQRPVEYQHNPLLSPSYTLDLSDRQNPYLLLESYFVKPHETVQFSNQRDILLSARIPFDDFITNVITILGTDSLGKTVPAEAKIVRGLSRSIGNMSLNIDISTFQDPAHCAELFASILLNSALVEGKVFGAESIAEVVDYSGARRKKEGSKLFNAKIAQIDAAISRLIKSRSNKDIYAAHVVLEDLFSTRNSETDTDLLLETAMNLHARSLGLCEGHYHEYSIADRKMAIQGPPEKEGIKRDKKEKTTLLLDYLNEKYYYTQVVHLPHADIKTFELAEMNGIYFTGNRREVNAVEETSVLDIRSEGESRIEEDLIYLSNHYHFKVRPSVKRISAALGYWQIKSELQFLVQSINTEAEIIGPDGSLSSVKISIPHFSGKLRLKNLGSVRINHFIGKLITNSVGVNMDLNERKENMWVSTGITIHNMIGSIDTTLSKISIGSWIRPKFDRQDRSEIYIDARDNPLIEKKG